MSLDPPKYVNLSAFFIDFCKSYFPTFLVKPTSVPKWGGGGQANFGTVKISKAATHP